MDDLASAGVELAVVVAYGRIIPARLLEQVPMVNLHFSLLPRWRGAAPVERRHPRRRPRDGRLSDEGGGGARHGSRLRRAQVPLDDDITLAALRARAGRRGAARWWWRRWPTASAGLPTPRAAAGRGHHRGQVRPTRICTSTGPDRRSQLRRVVRLGRAWTTFRGKRLSVLGCRAGRGGPATAGAPPGTLGGTVVVDRARRLVLRRVQPESRSPMSADEWVRGVRPAAGERLGTD